MSNIENRKTPCAPCAERKRYCQPQIIRRNSLKEITLDSWAYNGPCPNLGAYNGGSCAGSATNRLDCN